MLKSSRSALIFSVIFCVPASASADRIERFFSVERLECGNRVEVEEWSIIGSQSGTVAVERQARLEHRNDFQGLRWQFDGKDLVREIIVNDDRNRPVFAFRDLDSETPRIETVGCH